MHAAELDDFIATASALTKARGAEATRAFGLGGHARYHLDLSAQILTFFDENDAPVVAARAVPVGSLAPASKSWQWSWGSDSIPEAASEPILAVRQFGETHEIAALQGPFAPCDEALAWALAAVSLKILDAECVYRIEQPRTLLFLLLFDVEVVRTRAR